MPNFYDFLVQTEQLLDKHLNINDLGQGLITVNDHLVDTNQQLEMLSPGFFSGMADDNPTIRSYQQFFQKVHILPNEIPEIPLIRDIPLRMKTFANQTEQQQICARFLEETILPNNLSMLFAREYNELKQMIANCFKTRQVPVEKKLITRDEEGNLLSSGGYHVELHRLKGMDLWLRTPESYNEKDIAAATEKSLQDSANSDLIAASLKFKLLETNRIAFNVRGVAKTIKTKNDLRNLGGGHQHFILLDRNTKTIYAINNTIGATDEDPRAFKQQIEMFLHSLGERTQYKFEFIQGKSRQPDDRSYLSQVCSISQFCHYAALLSGVPVGELRDTVPTKITTLMYLLQYAVINQDADLKNILDDILNKINPKLETPSQQTENPKVPLLQPIVETSSLQSPPVKVTEQKDDSIQSNSGRDKLIVIIKTLVANIENQQNGRTTTRNSDWKTNQFTAIKQSLENESECTPGILHRYINEVHAVCAQRRNALHFWSTPHSVVEFNELLAQSDIERINSSTNTPNR